METENNKWILHGCSPQDPQCIQTAEQLIEKIETIGFLPLFQNDIPQFSVEEWTVPERWWAEDSRLDPWAWRERITAEGNIAYGKFFGKKAGFIAKQWIPYFANARRDGYDFDALWEEGKAPKRQKQIMDIFTDHSEMISYELKNAAGFGKGGEKNFDGTLTALQMQLYLCVKSFRRRIGKNGLPYGWTIAVYATPESLWGYDFVTSAYAEEPQRSHERICNQLLAHFPNVTPKQLVGF